MLGLKGLRDKLKKINQDQNLIVSVGKKSKTQTFECKFKDDEYACEDITDKIKKITKKSVKKIKAKVGKASQRMVRPRKGRQPRHKKDEPVSQVEPVVKVFQPQPEFQTPIQSQMSMTNAQLQRLINKVDMQEQLSQNIIQSGRRKFTALENRVNRYNRGHEPIEPTFNTLDPPRPQFQDRDGSVIDLDEDALEQPITIDPPQPRTIDPPIMVEISTTSTQTEPVTIMPQSTIIDDYVMSNTPTQNLLDEQDLGGSFLDYLQAKNTSPLYPATTEEEEAEGGEETEDESDTDTIVADPEPEPTISPQRRQAINRTNIKNIVDTKLSNDVEFTQPEMRLMMSRSVQLGKKRYEKLVAKGYDQFSVFIPTFEK